MTYDVEHQPYAYLSSSHTHVFALVRCLFRSFAHMLIRLIIFLLLSFMSSLYIFDNGYQICLLQIFLPSLWLLFSLSWLTFNFVSSDHNFIVTFILIQLYCIGLKSKHLYCIALSFPFLKTNIFYYKNSMYSQWKI